MFMDFTKSLDLEIIVVDAVQLHEVAFVFYSTKNVCYWGVIIDSYIEDL